jgi:hypothetical protein
MIRVAGYRSTRRLAHDIFDNAKTFVIQLDYKTRQRLLDGFLAVFFLGTLLLPLLNFAPAQAATATILPNGDVTTEWLHCNGTTSCTNPRYSYINEDASGFPDVSTHIGTGGPGVSPATAAVEFSMTSVPNVETVSSITVYLNLIATTSANGGADDAVDVQLRIGGTLMTAVRITVSQFMTNPRTATFNGNWSQADLDGAQVLITRVVLGSGNPTNQQDDIRLRALSADVTYVAATNLDQSSYRWFDNDEAPRQTNDPVTAYNKDDTMGVGSQWANPENVFASDGNSASVGAGYLYSFPERDTGRERFQLQRANRLNDQGHRG